MKTTIKPQVSYPTPFRRLTAAICIGEIGLNIALITPVVLLLTLKLQEIDPQNFASSFGFSTGLGALFAMLGNPIGGAISDKTRLKFGRRRTWILVGVVLGALAVICIGLSTKVWMLIASWCIAQMFFNFALAAFKALIPDQIDESKRGKISGILGLITPIAPILGMGIVGIMGTIPLYLKFITLSVICIVLVIISVMLIREDPNEQCINEKHKQSIGIAERMSRIYPSPRKYPIYTWGWLTRFCVAIAFCSSTYNSVMLMQRLHYNAQQTTTGTTILAMVGLVFVATSSIFGGFLSDKLRKQKPFVIISPLVVAIGLIINAVAPSFAFLVIGNSLIYFGYGIYSAVDTALIARILPRKEDAAKDFGIMNLASTAPQSLVPFVAPSLLAIGGWPFFFGALAVTGILSSLLVIPIPEMSSNSSTDGLTSDVK